MKYYIMVGLPASGKSTSSAKTVYGNDISNIYWLSIDQSQIDMGLEEGSYGPLKADTTKGAGGAYIYVYVTPRHTVEYYSMYEETSGSSLLKYSYAQGWTSGSSTCRLFTGLSNGKGSYTSKQNGSANWQQTQGTSSTITLSQVVENYEKFNSREIAVFVVQDPQGFITTKNNGIAGLASILFI